MKTAARSALATVTAVLTRAGFKSSIETGRNRRPGFHTRDGRTIGCARDMRANVGPLADRLVALRQRIKRTIEHIYPSKQSLTLPASSGNPSNQIA